MANYKYNIFLSYAHENKTEVMNMLIHLTKAGLTVWKDTEEMHQRNIDEHMMNGIRNSHVFVACISTNYKNSLNCTREFNYGIAIKKDIISVLFEEIGKDCKGIIDRLGFIGFHLARKNFYKPDDIDQIIKSIKDLLIVSFVAFISTFIKF
jgi:hypothetical protein